jgi:hypothetical protein
MRDPAAILAAAARTLDLTRPVAVLLIGVLGHIADYEQASAIVAGLLGGVPTGSYLAVVDSFGAERSHVEATEQYASTGAVPYKLRIAEEIKGFFTGLDLLPPGLVRVADWRPDPSPFPAVQVDTLAGVGRKRATTTVLSAP